MWQIIKDFFSENGRGSSKRWIAISVSGVLAWSIAYSICKAANSSERYSLIVATMVFVLVLLGVATMAQIISVVKGTPPPKEDEIKP